MKAAGVIRRSFSTDFETIQRPRTKGIAATRDTLDTTIRQTWAIIEKLKQVKQGLLHLLTRYRRQRGELRRQARHRISRRHAGVDSGGVGALAGRDCRPTSWICSSEWFQRHWSVRICFAESNGRSWETRLRVRQSSDPDTSKRFEDRRLAERGWRYRCRDGSTSPSQDRFSRRSGAPDLRLLVQQVGRFVAKACSLRFLRVESALARLFTRNSWRSKGHGYSASF